MTLITDSNMQLPDDFWQWVDAHADDDLTRLRLRYGRMRDAEIRQIECRRKYSRKLADELSRAPGRHFYFATMLSGEQSSSDRAAALHAALAGAAHRMADLTAGMGVDAFAMARGGCAVDAVEIDPDIAAAIAYNAPSQCGRGTVNVYNCDCRDYLADCNVADCMFIDPARRDANGGRVFAINDCHPDVTALLPDIRRKCRRLIVKMSPMLDISDTVRRLGDDTAAIYAIGTPTECKELVAVLDFGRETAPAVITAVTMTAAGNTDYCFTAQSESVACYNFDTPQNGDYVYEPYPAVMKAAPFRSLCAGGVFVAHANTHLYFSHTLRDDFPGTAFRIIDIRLYRSSVIKRFKLDYPAINVTARNFGLNADALRRKLGVADCHDDSLRLFAITASSGDRLLIVCRREP